MQRHLPLWILVLSTSSACVNALGAADIDDLSVLDGADDFSSDSRALYGNPRGYFPRDANGVATVPVCWLQGGFADEKEWVRDSVEREWAANSRLEFTGWGRCDAETPTFAIRIAIEDTGRAPWSYVGRVSRAPSMSLNFTFRNWSQICSNGRNNFPGDDLEYCIRGIALHEFGHALGFFHEQDHPGNRGFCDKSRAQHGSEGVVITPYDAMSVMNYCAPWGQQSLSELDIEGLQVVYGAPISEPELPEPWQPEPQLPEPPALGASCRHTFGGTYADTACSASYQCCDGAWRLLSAGGCGACLCTETSGQRGCSR
ncbi:MAG: hypothetical protein KF901_20890 [Myxococcales bacterium]|nr:hypothetical protein [Myxococcales bacterium]